ncbi:uncharacterized protein [Macrobrachium rosenbergii]|uniref:uncharacterized protein n=1 Tax=Macrobrachium rosenbergii TaxID=79674 RepID=UPI0034D4F6C2
MPVEIVPITIGTLGTIPRSLKRNLEKLDAEVAAGLLQKIVLLESAHIVRKVMDSSGGRVQPRTPHCACRQVPTTVVVVQQPIAWYRYHRGPSYLRSDWRLSNLVKTYNSSDSSLQVCGFALSLPLIICLGFSGATFFIIGATTISIGKSHDSLFDGDGDVNPTDVVGALMIIIGVVCTAGCIGLACYSKKQYQKLNHGLNDPGRVINRNPSPVSSQQPVMNPGQPGVFLPTSAGFYDPQPMGGYPAGYLPAAGGPMGYPPPGGQVYVYPAPTSAPYGAGPPYQQAPVEKAPRLLILPLIRGHRLLDRILPPLSLVPLSKMHSSLCPRL